MPGSLSLLFAYLFARSLVSLLVDLIKDLLTIWLIFLRGKQLT